MVTSELTRTDANRFEKRWCFSWSPLLWLRLHATCRNEAMPLNARVPKWKKLLRLST